jgi:DNA invertase Pin-like site-specific DNA recombinase
MHYFASTRAETGRIVLTVLGMVAQMERRFIRERQREEDLSSVFSTVTNLVA